MNHFVTLILIVSALFPLCSAQASPVERLRAIHASVLDLEKRAELESQNAREPAVSDRFNAIVNSAEHPSFSQFNPKVEARVNEYLSQISEGCELVLSQNKDEAAAILLDRIHTVLENKEAELIHDLAALGGAEELLDSQDNSLLKPAAFFTPNEKENPRSARAKKLFEAAEGAPGATKGFFQASRTVYGFPVCNALTKVTAMFPCYNSCAYVIGAIAKHAGLIGKKIELSPRVVGVKGEGGKYLAGLLDHLRGKKISNSADLKKGDLVVWKGTKSGVCGLLGNSIPRHVGIYVGNGYTIDNSFNNGGASRRSLSRACWEFDHGVAL